MNHVGLGLRREHYAYLLANKPRVAQWFEAISENYLDSHGRPKAVLNEIRRNFPVALHGVSLSIGSALPPSRDYLSKLKDLADEIDPFLISDHFCWTGLQNENLHDLLPLPFCEETVDTLCRNIDITQTFLGRSIALENVSSYITFRDSTMFEWEFICEISKRSGCRILLDVNNVHVNATNHSFDALTYLNYIPGDSVAEIHIAGHSNRGAYLFDTHSTPVSEEVWRLLEHAVNRMPDVPVLLERDEDIPEFPELEMELEQALNHCASAETDSYLEVTQRR
ncbi:MAG: DUF692 domain-containing protein [Spirochaetia bacterium]|nr:DUF692 domain-containing protein [Spirochaetia bacterium]